LTERARREDAIARAVPAGLLLGLAGLQLVVGSRVPLDPDETYYWEWSRRLAFGYYDHPPAIAWLIRAGTSLFGNTPLGVRFFPILANFAGGLLLLRLAGGMGERSAPCDAALVLLSIPIVAVWLLLATPDCPLFLANALALYTIVRAMQAQPGSPRALSWWLGSGVALGLGLVSKLVALALPLGILLALLSRRDLRLRLAEPGPYVAVLLAGLIVLPTVLLNPASPVAFQLHHGLGASRGSPFLQELDLIAGQVGMAGGILFVLLGVAVAGSLRRSADPVRYVLAVIAAVTFGLFALSALRHRVEANWPLPAYMPAVVLLAWHPGGRSWHRWVRAGMIVGGLAVALAYLEMVTPIWPSAEEMIRRGHGWEEVAQRVSHIHRSQLPNRGRLWLAGNTYQVASELAFHLPDHPTVFALNLQSRTNQYSFWPGFAEMARQGDDLVLVLSSRPASTGPITDLRSYFRRVQVVDSTGFDANRREVPRRRIWLLEDWQGSWPRSGKDGFEKRFER
jgi:Dolichyl-phosphate-mannose-protein mannosyltransferase